jgi:hypothetical protein
VLCGYLNRTNYQFPFSKNVSESENCGFGLLNKTLSKKPLVLVNFKTLKKKTRSFGGRTGKEPMVSKGG